MSSLSTSFRADLLDYLFLNTGASNFGDATGIPATSAAGNIHLSLHTADPSAGNQTTNEATYTGYARVAVPRNGTNWERTGNVMANLIEQAFAAATGGSETITHMGFGFASTGTGNLFFARALNSSIVIAGANETPTFEVGDITFTLA